MREVFVFIIPQESTSYIHHSECAVILWHRLHLFETWAPDSDVSMRSPVSQTVSACFGILSQLRSIRRSLSHLVFQSLIAALVLTKLDFGNAALAGIPLFQLDRLQAVMNAAARLIYQSSRCDHITPLLQCLHWLRALERISYKLAVLVYQCLHGLAPAYLVTLYSLSPDYLVDNACACHQLRQWRYHSRPSTIGDRALPVAAAKIWNNLPSEVTFSDCLRTFKAKLKTHLFSSLFPQLTVKWLQCSWHFSLKIYCIVLYCRPPPQSATLGLHSVARKLLLISRINLLYYIVSIFSTASVV